MNRIFNQLMLFSLVISFGFSMAYADNGILQKTVAELTKRVERIEKVPVSAGQQGFLRGMFSFAAAHPVVTATAAVAAVCYSKRSRNLIRTGWGWLTAGAAQLLGEQSWTVAGMHAIGYAADKAEVVIKEVNGEASQEVVLSNLQQQLARSTRTITSLQRRLGDTETNYNNVLRQSVEIKEQLEQTAKTLKTMTEQLSLVQQEELTAKLRSRDLETQLIGQYNVLQKQQQQELNALAQQQRRAVEAMGHELEAVRQNIALLKKSIEALSENLTSQIKNHAHACDGKTSATHQQISRYETMLQGLEQQEQKLQEGLRQLLEQRMKE